MAIFYHGSSTGQLQIRQHIRSRYGFHALFFTNNINLARLYSSHNGGIYKIENPPIYQVLDYHDAPTYTSDFRNLMFKLNQSNIKSVLIKNALDFPTKQQRIMESSDILIFFDTKIIPEITSL